MNLKMKVNRRDQINEERKTSKTDQIKSKNLILTQNQSNQNNNDFELSF